MDAEKISYWIKNSDEIRFEDYVTIKNNALKYPYFQLLQLLYLKACYKFNIQVYRDALEKICLRINNRENLYKFIHHPFSIVNFNRLNLENFNYAKEKELSNLEKNILHHNINITTPYQLEDIEETNLKKEESSNDVISNFIKNNPKINRIKKNIYTPTKAAKDSLEEDTSMYTETFAKILEKQGNYKKAIEIYHQLILKIPQKNTYFAEKIKELNNKLNKK